MNASIYPAREFTIRRVIRERAPQSTRANVRKQAEEVAIRHFREGISMHRSIGAGEIFLRLHGAVSHGTTTPPPAA